jgi:hypothetical protein
MKAASKWPLFLTLFAGTACIAQTTAVCTYQMFQYPGAAVTYPSGINRWCTIVGWSAVMADQTEFGFIRSSTGGFAKFSNSVSGTALYRRNSSGATVGTYGSVGGGSQGLLLTGNTSQTIDYLGAKYTDIRGINDFGTMVGFRSGTSAYIGFKRWANGSFADIKFPNQIGTFPTAINDTGVIVGWVGTSFPPVGTSDGFVFANGKFVMVDDPNAAPGSTVLSDINASGTIVGTGWTRKLNTPVSHGFLILNGKFENLAVPGALYSTADGINAYGVIVGSATFNSSFGLLTKGYIAHCQ